MKRRKSIKKYKKGELLIVEDRSALDAKVSSGEKMPEEAEKIFAEICRNGEMLNGEDGQKYMQMFVRPKFFMGAADAAVIAGDSHFKGRSMLQYEKLGLVKPVVTAATQHNYDYGHDAERFVASMNARAMRREGMNIRYEACTFGAIHTRWPAVLVHPDGFIIDRDSGEVVALAEVKTAASAGPYWVNDFARDVIPLAYQDQCQVMMMVLGLKECWVLAYNKTGERDAFKHLKLELDEDRAVELLDGMMDFYNDTVKGIFYEDDDITPDEATALFHETDNSLGYIELSKRSKKILNEIDELQDERAKLKADIAEVEADIREIDKQLKLQKARMARECGKAPGGLYEDGPTTYRVEKRAGFSKDQEAMEMLRDNYPEAYEALSKYKPLLSMRITRTSSSNELCVNEIE